MSNGDKQEAVVKFDPPLSGYNEVKPRLFEMKAVAEGELGMVCIAQNLLRYHIR
jgi:hypothetical protein